MHTLAFLDPGHFHAALTLRGRSPGVHDDIFVYAEAGRELDDFLALIEAFNRRSEEPTSWRPVVWTGSRPIERLIAECSAQVVILAGKNDRKMPAMRQLHDAGFHVLADKPWLVGAAGLDDLRHVVGGGPLAVEMMTGRHEITSILVGKLVREGELFGDFDIAGGRPAIEISGVHHLEKRVHGQPLRRPPWYFDVRVQGDGLADIPTHMVDQVQRVVGAASGTRVLPAPELTGARTWCTEVPLALFSRVTGQADFPPELADVVDGARLAYRSNAELTFRLGEVTAALDTHWELTEPPGGGDRHRSLIRGTRAEIRVEQHEGTGFRRRLSVAPMGNASRVRDTLACAMESWQGEHPGLEIVEMGEAYEIRVPGALDVGHERHFPLMLRDFLSLVDGSTLPGELASATLAKYTLLGQAATEDQRRRERPARV